MSEHEAVDGRELEAALRSASDVRILASFDQALHTHTQRRRQAAEQERLRRFAKQSLYEGGSMKKYILTAIMTLLLITQAYFFGVSDLMVLVFIGITAGFIYSTLIRMYEGNRKVLYAHARSDSLLHAFLSRERMLLMRFIVVLMSLFLSSILVFLIKGMVLQQGYSAFFFVIVVASLLLYRFVNEPYLPNPTKDTEYHATSAHGNEMLRIFYAVMILNLMLAAVFSAHDTFIFKTSDVDFNNFTDKAVEQSIERNESNDYSRILVNAYLLMDYAKVALTKVLVSLFSLEDNFYGFYMIISVLNLFKMIAFSFSFVLLQKGFDGAATALTPVINSSFVKGRLQADKLLDQYFRK